MTGAGALQKLLTWLSPAFPVGAFAWSAGLETAIAEKAVTDSGTLQDWISGALAHGGIRADAIILAHAYRDVGTPSPTLPAGGRVSAGGLGTTGPHPQRGTSLLAGEDGRGDAISMDSAGQLRELADLCLALTPAVERNAETSTTGDAFAIAARARPPARQTPQPHPSPYPVAVGAIAAAHGIGLGATLLGYLTAAVHSQISVAVRLVPLGQTEGLRVMAALENRIAALADAAASATLADLGSIAYAADIAQLRHETLEPRIFRS